MECGWGFAGEEGARSVEFSRAVFPETKEAAKRFGEDSSPAKAGEAGSRETRKTEGERSEGGQTNESVGNCAAPASSTHSQSLPPAPMDSELRRVPTTREIENRTIRTYPVCPFLPAPQPGLDWRTLHRFRDGERGADFYFACLEYSHSLWQRGLAARALLCLDRAFGADVGTDDLILRAHPLPYAAVAWLLRQTPRDVFIGNPRVHFQHYADRMNEPRREQRSWRAWACWALARHVRPDWPGDPRHRVLEPTRRQIAAGLRQHGHGNEVSVWESAFAI